MTEQEIKWIPAENSEEIIEQLEKDIILKQCSPPKFIDHSPYKDYLSQNYTQI